MTQAGRRCYYATRGSFTAAGAIDRLMLPPHVQTQLDAMGARVAWWCMSPPEVCVRGEAAERCEAVRRPDVFDRLTFL